MNNLELPRSEPSKGFTPPPPPFSDAVYDDIFNNTPKPSAEDLEKSRQSRERMEQGFDWKDTNIIEMSAAKAVAQENRTERLAQDQKAAEKLSEEIKKAA